MINGNKNFSVTVETDKANNIKAYLSKETDIKKEDKFGKVEIFKFDTKREALQFIEDTLSSDDDYEDDWS